MKILGKEIFARSRDKPSSIPTGRATSATNWYMSYLSPYRLRSADLLKELRSIPTEEAAIKFITKKTADPSMSLWNFLRMSNQGHQMKFYDINNREKSLSDIESEWREFAARINPISNAGLDGLIDLCHKNAIIGGSQMCEAVVNESRTDIEDVYAIDPETVHWKWEKRDGKEVCIPYQYSDKGEIDLSKANFFYVPLDPDTNDPRGTLIFAPAIQAIDCQLQTTNDVHAVLHHQGFGKNDVSIDVEKLYAICPANIKNDPTKWLEYIDKITDNLRNNLESMAPDSDYIHTNDSTITALQGANANRSLDIRAITEGTDVQVNNGLKQLSTFTNRRTGNTETYSSVEMKIFVQGILSLQRGSKRLVESIAKLWLRVRGYQAIPVFTHNTVDWQSEIDKEEVATSKLDRYAKAVMMGWIDNDTAAREVMNAKQAVSEPKIESARITFSIGGGNGDNDKHKAQVNISGANEN